MSNISRHLDKTINSIPDKPGIYQMKDIEGNVIYIGKSKTLKKRVKSYFYKDHKFEKINRMVFNIHDISYITTDTHLEAQILECALIKKIKPIYNSQFKNHKKYNYLKVENYNRSKPLTIVNERKGENCFGPYRNRNTLLEIIEIFKSIYPITKHEDGYEFTYKVLPQSMNKETFENNKKCLTEIISTRECMMKFISQIEQEMEEAASALHFGKASVYRDIMNCMNYLNKQIDKENKYSIDKRILLGEKVEDGYKIFCIVNRRIILKKKYFKIAKKDIREFLEQVKKLEEQALKIRNEKRDLDFMHIIDAEIRDKSNKVILSIEANYSLDKFINDMRCLL